MRLQRTVGEHEKGAAYVEFLIAFIPLFVMFMGMVQMALMYAGDLVVQHAASRATRAAVVVLDDDPARYDGARRRNVLRVGVSSAEDGISAILRLFGAGGSVGIGTFTRTGGPRYQAIRQAASMPLMAISPSVQQLTGMESESVLQAIDSPESRAAVGALAYNNAAMGVTFPRSPGATSYQWYWPRTPGTRVTTRVTYLFHCGVPLANRLMCETYPNLRLGPGAAIVEGIVSDLRSGELGLGDAMERIARADAARRRHERDEPALEELESAGGSDLMYLTWATGARFKVLRGEATMPLQYAEYEYR